MHPFPVSRAPREPAGVPETPEIVAAIPARYGSTRLPGKPLLALAGRPMIEHVYRRVASARGLARIVVLTDDERIARAVAAFGGEVELTPAACASGTDRIAHAARRWPGAAAVVNVQGDEPLIDPDAITALGKLVRDGAEMATLARPLKAEEAQQPGVVKVVLDRGGRALYFSRSLIPFPRSPGEVFPLAHIGLYGFSAETLQHFARLDETNLERAEGLEQLRALWYGLRISVSVGHWTSIAVDTAEDLEKVRGIYLSERRTA